MCSTTGGTLPAQRAGENDAQGSAYNHDPLTENLQTIYHNDREAAMIDSLNVRKQNRLDSLENELQKTKPSN